MSTRGAVGMRMNGIDKIGYNHFDSYLTGLGKSVLTFLKKHSIEELKEIYNKIEFNNNKDLEVWDEENNEINLAFDDAHIFLNDSLFCEYAYIINLDDNCLEFYEGFNRNPNEKGRYASLKKNDNLDYYGVKLKMEIPLNEIDKYEILSNEGITHIN